LGITPQAELYQLLIALMESLRNLNYVVITHQPNPREEAVILQMQLPFLLANLIQVTRFDAASDSYA
jgi:hypothetical protein